MRLSVIFFVLLASGCASPKPLPPCPPAAPPHDTLVKPEELELSPEERMPAGTVPPRRLASPPPVLPEGAFEGARSPQVVIVKYHVGEGGAVGSTEVTRGQAPFSQAAVEAVRAMRFEPATHDGQPIEVYQMRRFVFEHSYAHCDGPPEDEAPRRDAP